MAVTNLFHLHQRNAGSQQTLVIDLWALSHLRLKENDFNIQ